jgi:hypothetical protein
MNTRLAAIILSLAIYLGFHLASIIWFLLPMAFP